MLTVPGYTVIEPTTMTPGSSAYRARRDADNLPVTLKVLRAAGGRGADVARFRHQMDRIARLSSPRLLAVHGVEERSEGVVVVLEHVEGPDLASALRERGKLPLGEALDLACALAEALQVIHAGGLIHGDVRPHNVWLGKDGAIKLGGFGADAELTRAHKGIYDPVVIADVLPYVSPERTGRMNRGVDHRTDLYSLAVVLYQALLGRRPFEASDPMEIIHAHLALPPVSPTRLDRAVPEAVSDVALKLLAKDAEERYQSAEGLLVDLEQCRTSLRATGRIERFVAGQRDRNDLFQIHQKLYGRERDGEALVAAFERRLSGAREILLVSGYSGIGKSTLVQEILKPLAREKGYYTSGKHDQYNRELPYGAIIQAFDGLVRQLLSESDARIASWRNALLEALGSNARVVCDVIPALAHVLGEVPPVEALGPIEAQARLSLCFSRLVSVFARRAHPLVLFLDDLQWIDPASLALLRALLADDTLEGFFFCGAYRNNEVGPGHPLLLLREELASGGLAIEEIVLAPLERGHLLEMLRDCLKRDDCGPLADATLRKTGGNPFFVKAFLRSLHDHGVLAFEAGAGWRWDLAQIEALHYTDNVVDLMVRTIRRLPPPTQETLTLAATIGNRFDLDVLCAVSEGSPLDVYSRLDPALSEGLILATGEKLRFAHDKVQEGATSMLPASERPGLHLRIGRLLASKLDPADARGLFDAVGHLNGAGDLIAGAEERLALARMNLDAAARAEESAAFGAALHYLEQGLTRLPADAWTSQYRMRFLFATRKGLMEAINGQHDRALATLSECLDHADSRLDRTEVLRLKMKVHVLKADLPAAISEGLVAVRAFGIDLPPFPDDATSDAHIRATMQLVGDRPLDFLLDLPPLQDPEIRILHDVLEEFDVPSNFLGSNLYEIVAAKKLEYTIRHGLSLNAAIACMHFGSVLCTRWDIEPGYQLGRVAYRLAALYPDRRTAPLLHNGWACLVQHWKEGYSACKESLRAGFHAAVETGHHFWSFACASNGVTMSVLQGVPLGELVKEAGSYSAIRKLDKFNIVTWILGAAEQLAHNLSVETERPAELVGDFVDINAVLEAARRIDNKTALDYAAFYELLLCVFQGAFEDAARRALRIDLEFTAHQNWFGNPPLYGYGGVALTQAATAASPDDRALFLARAGAFAERLSRCAPLCPENHEHRRLLLEAELTRLRGDPRDAWDLYDAAIGLARRGRYLHDEALANELCARHWLSLGKTTVARAYLAEAHRLYGSWGATQCTRRLEQAFPDLVPRGRPSRAPAPGAGVSAGVEFDFASVLKASQAISGEIVLDRLIDALMRILIENAGARRGLLVLDREGQLCVEAEHRVEEDEVRKLGAVPVASRADLAVSVVNFVARTRESVLLEDRAAYGAFGHDPYLAASAPRSTLVVPIVAQGHVTGVIYLENDLTSFAFTKDHAEVLRLLSAQVAVSIENAKLYAELERKVEARTQELRTAHDEIMAYHQIEQERRAQEATMQRLLIERQQEVIYTLSTPIIEVWDGVIVLPLMGAVDDARSSEIMSRLLARIADNPCQHVILDLTGVEQVDANSAERLVRIAQAARLLGTRVVISGIRAAVAQALVQHGADAAGLLTRATVKDALRTGLSRSALGPPHQGRI
ncbi:AAA family ATPase [Sorangium sp. So ce1335]|uniref:AAA family ATPase n=1 Tax=Sorangium sp. So ce1335 TaxID=3133335 RepID=UPI003F5F46E3